MIVRELGLDWIRGASSVWADLLRQSDADPIFMSWEWISSWMETLGDAAGARILGWFRGPSPLAVMPLATTSSSATMWAGQLSLDASVEQTGADYSDIVCARGYEHDAARAIAGWLTRRRDWVQCEFRDVLPTALGRQVAALVAAGHVLEDRAGSVCPRTSLRDGWQRILQDRFERKRRYNIERQIRLAEEREGLRLVFHDTPETIAQAFPILVKLHAERKAAQGVRSTFSQPDRLDFHRRAALKLAASARAALVVTLESQREVLSAAYCFRSSTRLYYFQTGVSASGSARAAGSTLLYMLLRWAANQGYEWFDFLKGDEDYKRTWATDHVEQRTIRITRRGLRGCSMLALRAMHRSLASAYRKTLGGRRET